MPYENIFQIADTLTWIRGRHSLKFGIDFRRQQRNFYQVTAPRGFFDFGGVYTNDLTTANGGNGLADLLLGVPIANEQDFLLGLYPTRYWDLAAFVQDDFRVRPNLTINLGLRYDVLTRQRTGRQLRSESRHRRHILWAEPRFARRRAVRQEQLGAALRVRLVRATEHSGAKRLRSLLFGRGQYLRRSGTEPSATDFPGQQNFNAGQVPTTAQLISSGFPATIPPGDSVNILGPVKTTGPRRTIPIIMEWNLSVQHQFAQNFVAQIGYVGTRAYHLWNHEASDLNQPRRFSIPISAGRPTRATALFRTLAEDISISSPT